PTPEEVKRAEFYERADEFRAQEGDEVHCLLRLDGEADETRFVVTPIGLKIGRAPPAGVVVFGAWGSPAHCLVECAAGRARVTDLNSTNGPCVDNKRVDRSEMLEVGSVLRVGNVSFEHVVRTREELEPQLGPHATDEDALPRSAAGH